MLILIIALIVAGVIAVWKISGWLWPFENSTLGNVLVVTGFIACEAFIAVKMITGIENFNVFATIMFFVFLTAAGFLYIFVCFFILLFIPGEKNYRPRTHPYLEGFDVKYELYKKKKDREKSYAENANKMPSWKEFRSYKDDDDDYIGETLARNFKKAIKNILMFVLFAVVVFYSTPFAYAFDEVFLVGYDYVDLSVLLLLAAIFLWVLSRFILENVLYSLGSLSQKDERLISYKSDFWVKLVFVGAFVVLKQGIGVEYSLYLKGAFFVYYLFEAIKFLKSLLCSIKVRIFPSIKPRRSNSYHFLTVVSETFRKIERDIFKIRPLGFINDIFRYIYWSVKVKVNSYLFKRESEKINQYCDKQAIIVRKQKEYEELRAWVNEYRMNHDSGGGGGDGSISYGSAERKADFFRKVDFWSTENRYWERLSSAGYTSSDGMIDYYRMEEDGYGEEQLFYDSYYS